MLLPLLGVNNCLPLLHMSKAIFSMNSIEKRINQFATGYMFNPTLHVKRRSDTKLKILEIKFSSKYTVWY